MNAAVNYIQQILTDAIEHQPEARALIIADNASPLANLLAEAYRTCLPSAAFIAFHETTPEKIIEHFQALKPNDLVVLIQSGSFRLNAFRIRVELFNQGLKVIEHPHLARMQGVEMDYYVASLHYDAAYYRTVGRALKHKIDATRIAKIDSGGEYLVFSAGLESAKLNIGDYRDMKNVGGQFPIGEVFTESLDLEAVNGRVRIHAFGDASFSVHRAAVPIVLIIERGRVVGVEHSNAEFETVLENIRKDEGEVWVRECGFGLNRAFSREKTVTDIGTYERMCGIHLSLGAKHSMYRKPQFTRSTAKHHVDVFAVTEGVYLDDDNVYSAGQWVV